MRIIIDMQATQTESRFRGIGRYTMSFTHAVVRNRGKHEIILALNGLFPDTIEPIRAAFDGLLIQENIRVWSTVSPVACVSSANDWRRQSGELVREAFLASLKPDIVHVCSLFEGYIDDAITSVGRFDRTTPVSVTLYDLIPLLNPDHYLKPNPRYAEYYQRKIEYLKQAAAFLAISEFARQEGVAHLSVSKQKMVNVSTAIEPHFHPRTIDEDTASQLRAKFGITRPFLLYTGGADARKNLPRLIEAYAALPLSLRNGHQLVFAGKMLEGHITQFRHLAKSAGLKADELIFSGYVSDEELVQLYNLCKLFVFPSWHEGFGLPALEAMACGTPVISANTSSLPEVIGLDEALFDPFDVKAITAKLAQALEDDDFRTRLRRHGEGQAKKFSWDETAKRTIATWESLQINNLGHEQVLREGRKPRLAFVSPMPPERTGIADYSAALLPALSEYYDIDVVVAQKQVDDPWGKRYGRVRDVAWLCANARHIDRVLYQMGNSSFHQHMLPLMAEIPGTVVLHDFYLSGLMAWLEFHGWVDHAWTKALYDSHGYTAVKARYQNVGAAKQRYPVNAHILWHARGIIVHSEYSRDLARLWYGADWGADWRVIPLLRTQCNNLDKVEARRQLGFGEADFLACSFGFLDVTKLNNRLVQAWFVSELAKNEHCHLIFVGENHGGDYGVELLKTIHASDCRNRIRITGFASPEMFKQYLAAADVAVQLRTQSRGETSAAVLDCMNHGLSVIVNAHGAMAELDRDAVLMLPDVFDTTVLVDALEGLWRSPEERQRLGQQAHKRISENHAPQACARQYAEAIESAHAYAANGLPALIQTLANETSFQPADADLLQLAAVIGRNHPLPRLAKRLYLDVTATSRSDLKTGIERVARALTMALLESPPEGYRIEPVYLSHDNETWCYRHARRYTLGLIGCAVDGLEDEIVDPDVGDVLLGLDLSGDMLVQAEQSGLFQDYRNRGVSVYATVFDLLPLRLPALFPPGADRIHQKWLETISKFDGAVCISKAVADDLRAWQDDEGVAWENRRPYSIGWFYLGADVASSAPTRGLPPNAEEALRKLKARPSFLMVGTIEPRKGYGQTLDAFEHLWREGLDANLVIVGREGWKDLPDSMRRDIPQTIERLRNHQELNKRLFWLEGISDEYLGKVYAASTCLIAASYGEGFGLPLIEAAQHKLLIIARDIPVFREVAGEHAYYFDESDGKGLSRAVKEWLSRWEASDMPNSQRILTIMSWKESAKSLIDRVIGGKWPCRQVSKEIRKKAVDEHLQLIHRARV
jgi:glycosyltransferase involved in cell wall biosynthesis